MEMLQVFLNPGAWIALLSLTLLEVVLGVDNIVFLSIMTSKLPEKEQPKARFTGLFMAMLARIGLLFCIALLMSMQETFFSFRTAWISGEINVQSIVILAGGLFLLYKSVTEIHHKVEGGGHAAAPKKRSSFGGVIAQIVAMDIILSLDSVLTAVGMVSVRDFGEGGAMLIMVVAVVVSVMVMMLFSGPVSNFVNHHPTVQMMALSFLLLIGVMLLAEAAHLAKLTVFGKEIVDIPKGYIYFAIGFTLLVEWLNLRMGSSGKRRKEAAAIKMKT